MAHIKANPQDIVILCNDAIVALDLQLSQAEVSADDQSPGQTRVNARFEKARLNDILKRISKLLTLASYADENNCELTISDDDLFLIIL